MRYDDIESMAGFRNISTRELVQRAYQLSTVDREMVTQYACLGIISKWFARKSS